MEIRTTRKGKPLLRLDGYDYVHDSIKAYVYWKCAYKALRKCEGRARTCDLRDGMPGDAKVTCEHNHAPEKKMRAASVKHTMTAAGPQLLQYDGFSYKWSKEEDSYEYWSCVKNGCPGSVMNRTDTPSDVRQNSKHDHHSSQPMCWRCEQGKKHYLHIVQVGPTSKCHIADCQRYLHSSCALTLSSLSHVFCSKPHRDRYQKMNKALSSTPSVRDNPRVVLHSRDVLIASTSILPSASSDGDNPQQMQHSEDKPIPSTSNATGPKRGPKRRLTRSTTQLTDADATGPKRGPKRRLTRSTTQLTDADAAGPKRGPKRRLTRLTTQLGQRGTGMEADEEAEPQSEAEEVQEREEAEVQREGQNIQQLIAEPRTKAKERRKELLHDLSMEKMRMEIELNRVIMEKMQKKMTLMEEQRKRDQANCERDEALHNIRITNMKREFELTVEKMQKEMDLIEEQRTREEERKKREEELHDVNMKISKSTMRKVQMELMLISNTENRAEGKRKRAIESHEREEEMYKMLKLKMNENH